ncbi:MAG: tRNA-dihydrouridine synthase family protein [Desulfobacterales bacterium]|nr:tRNA-dihydrouridine synthase family protein [Desulfobacterales bacterium]
MTTGPHSTIAELSALLNRPLRIGSRTIPKRLVFAPMSFLGHVAFRELLAGLGGFGLLFSEMCSSKTIPTENPLVSRHFRWRAEELPFLVCQIMGADPERMAAAAVRVEAEGFFGVDINFGCASTAICRRSCGAEVLKTPEAAWGIVERVRRAVRIPVSVKFRTGWQDDPAAAVGMARRFEDAGADAVTFHPRVAPDRRARPAKWDYIGLVKQALKIPVFGNGDVFDADACLRMLKQTGCDGVALGRIAVARPWVFAEWTGGYVPGPGVFAATAHELLRLTAEHFEEKAAVLRFRKFTLYFAANFQFGHTLFTRVQNAVSVKAIEAVLDAFFAASPEPASSPNMNYLQ